MDSADNSAIMTIDLSRGRFRVHKSTLNKMGRPQYIQFLVNPEEMLILDFRYSYRVSGEVDVANRVAYFSMKTLKRNER